MKKFVRVVGLIILYLILAAFLMATAGMFARWFLAVMLMSDFWYLVYIYPFINVGGLILFLNKRLREKTKKVFLNLFKKLFRLIQKSYKKTTI